MPKTIASQCKTCLSDLYVCQKPLPDLQPYHLKSTTIPPTEKIHKRSRNSKQDHRSEAMWEEVSKAKVMQIPSRKNRQPCPPAEKNNPKVSCTQPVLRGCNPYQPLSLQLLNFLSIYSPHSKATLLQSYIDLSRIFCSSHTKAQGANKMQYLSFILCTPQTHTALISVTHQCFLISHT